MISPIRNDSGTPPPHLCQSWTLQFLWRLSRFPVRLNLGGQFDGRNIGRTIVGSSLRGVFGLVLSFSLSPPSSALPPLVVAADVARPELRGFWKPGDFIVGLPQQQGRPGVRPLTGPEPILLPTDTQTWTPIGEDCDPAPKATGQFGGSPVAVVVIEDPTHPKVQMWMNERPIAEALLGRPSTVCNILIANADSVPGPELIISWRIDSQKDLRGFTVLRIPEALDPTPIGSQEQ